MRVAVHLLHPLTWTGCGKRTRAAASPGVSALPAYWPTVTMPAGYLAARHHIPDRHGRLGDDRVGPDGGGGRFGQRGYGTTQRTSRRAIDAQPPRDLDSYAASTITVGERRRHDAH